MAKKLGKSTTKKTSVNRDAVPRGAVEEARRTRASMLPPSVTSPPQRFKLVLTRLCGAYATRAEAEQKMRRAATSLRRGEKLVIVEDAT